MRQFAPQMKVQGIVTLKLRNAVTLELEEERVIENTLTNLAERRWCAGRSFLSNEGGGIHNDISISEDSVLAIPSVRAFPKTTAQPAVTSSRVRSRNWNLRRLDFGRVKSAGVAFI